MGEIAEDHVRQFESGRRAVGFYNERKNMSKITIEDKKVVTPKFRVSFPSLDKAKSFQGQAPKFGITMLFSKDTDLADLKRAVENAKIEKWGTDKTKWPSKRLKSGKVVSAIRSPFRDGDREKPDMMGYAGHIFVSASAKEDNQPGVVGRDRNRIDPKDVYAGCYARASLIAFAYDTAGNIGVSFSLQNVQKWAEGKKFSGKRAAEDEFDAIEGDDSDIPEGMDEMGEDDLGIGA